MEWSILGGLGLFAIALVGFIVTTNAKYLSIREYETYNTFVVRELDTITARLNILEQTRPTTGELEARLGGMKEHNNAMRKM